jgi:molybdopterin-containing oxidoreductase family membrane subunit
METTLPHGAPTALQPFRPTPGRALLGLLAFGTLGWLEACALVWFRGHAGLGTASYGVTWGITVVNVLHLIGISHVGIAVSAAVRVLRLEAYQSLARLAELVTLVALVTAVLEIVVDVGRPDRFLFATALHGRWHAPMVWSMTAITAYLLTSAVYLYLSLRRDFAALAAMDLGRRGPFRWLALGYVDTPESRHRHERTLHWLAVLLVPIMVSVHSVYGLFFGLLAARPGWFNPLQAPSFLLGAIVSGLSAILVVAAGLRRLYRWRVVLEDRMFRALAAVLALAVFLALYFVFSEHLTAQYAGLTAERALSTSLLSGPYARSFWATVVGGLALPFLVLFAQAIGPTVNVGLVAAAALAVNLATWAKRYLLVVPTQLLPGLSPPRPLVDYGPTGLELAATFGAYAFAGLLLLLLLRWVPLVELAAPASRASSAPRPAPPAAGGRPPLRRTAVLGLLLLGSFLVAWGLAGRELDGAPVKWLAGVAVLAAIPLAICLIPDRRPGRGDVTQAEATP